MRMTDPKIMMEVPAQIREMALNSVTQAEAAMSSFMQSAGKSVDAIPAPMGDVAKQALAISEKNLKASFEHARQLMQAKDIGEVMRLQSEFVRAQFGQATEQFKQLTGGVVAGSKEKPDLI
jgi:phasin